MGVKIDGFQAGLGFGNAPRRPDRGTAETGPFPTPTKGENRRVSPEIPGRVKRLYFAQTF